MLSTASSPWAHLVVVTVPLVLVAVALAVAYGPAAPWPRRRGARRVAVPVMRQGRAAEPPAAPPAARAAPWAARLGCALAALYLLVFWLLAAVAVWQLVAALITL